MRQRTLSDQARTDEVIMATLPKQEFPMVQITIKLNATVRAA